MRRFCSGLESHAEVMTSFDDCSRFQRKDTTQRQRSEVVQNKVAKHRTERSTCHTECFVHSSKVVVGPVVGNRKTSALSVELIDGA